MWEKKKYKIETLIRTFEYIGLSRRVYRLLITTYHSINLVDIESKNPGWYVLYAKCFSQLDDESQKRYLLIIDEVTWSQFRSTMVALYLEKLLTDQKDCQYCAKLHVDLYFWWIYIFMQNASCKRVACNVPISINWYHH